jgi:hypothetical protein
MQVFPLSLSFPYNLSVEILGSVRLDFTVHIVPLIFAFPKNWDRDSEAL